MKEPKYYTWEKKINFSYNHLTGFYDRPRDDKEKNILKTVSIPKRQN